LGTACKVYTHACRLAAIQDSDSDAESKAMLELKFEEQAHQLWRMERRLRELEGERDSALAAVDLSGRDWQRACESAEKKCAELEQVRSLITSCTVSVLFFFRVRSEE
jgi:hypothetical protein